MYRLVDDTAVRLLGRLFFPPNRSGFIILQSPPRSSVRKVHRKSPLFKSPKETPAGQESLAGERNMYLLFLRRNGAFAPGARATAASGATASASAERPFLFSLHHSANRKEHAQRKKRQQRIIENAHVTKDLQSDTPQTQPARPRHTA